MLRASRLVAALAVLIGADVSAFGKVSIRQSCKGVAWLQPAVAKALKINSERLAPLNKELAAKVAEGVDPAKASDQQVHIRCADEAERGFAYTSFIGGVPYITVAKQPSASYKPENYGAGLFHEFLHAIDPGDKLLVTSSLHNRGNFPDVVYGCEYATQRRIDNGWQRVHLFVYDFWTGSDQGIPQLAGGAPCDNCGYDQKVINKFAWICQNGPYLPAGARERIPVLEQAYCLLYGATKCREKACVSAVKPLVEASTAPDSTEVFAAMDKIMMFLEVAEAYARKAPGGNPEKTYEGVLNSQEIELLSALDKQGMLAACKADPLAY